MPLSERNCKSDGFDFVRQARRYATPRVLTGSGSGRSEGYIVHVYEDCIVLEGYEFVKGETFAYATYIIEK